MGLWTDLQKKFDKIEDIDELFGFLRDTVDDLDVCESATCTIFPNLHKLDQDRMSYQYSSLKEARLKIKNKFVLKKFEKQYNRFIMGAKQVFSEIFALKVAAETKNKLHKQYHEEYLQTLDKINDNDWATPIEVGDAAKLKMAEITTNALGFDPELAKKATQFRAFMKNMNKKDKKSSKKKPEVEA